MGKFEKLHKKQRHPNVAKGVIISEIVFYRYPLLRILMVKTEGKKILFLGDAYAATCKNAIANYGDRLDCDIVQVAHHAVNGGSVALYKAAGAKLYLIPNNREPVEKAKKKDSVVYWIVNNAPEMVFAGDGTEYFYLAQPLEGQ